MLWLILFSYIFLTQQQIKILPTTRYQHNGFASGIHEKKLSSGITQQVAYFVFLDLHTKWRCGVGWG